MMARDCVQGLGEETDSLERAARRRRHAPPAHAEHVPGARSDPRAAESPDGRWMAPLTRGLAHLLVVASSLRSANTSTSGPDTWKGFRSRRMSIIGQFLAGSRTTAIGSS